MDKKTLNQDELHILIGFIKRHGFTEPFIVAEILDHFACKVEEKMDQHPHLSLEAALAEAHQDFGVMGFRPIVRAYEANLKQKYRTVYRGELKKILAHPVYVVIALLIAAAFYKAWFWAEQNSCRQFLDINDIDIELLFVYGMSILFLSRKFSSFGLRNPVVKAILGLDTWVAFFIGLNPMHHYKYGTKVQAVAITVNAIFCFYLVVRFFALYTTLKKGYKDSEIVQDYLKSVDL